MSNPGQSPGRQLNALESLRGVAALMVLFYHLAELVKIPLPESLGFVSSHFGLGVPLFYALSGFVLSYGYASKLEGRSRIMAFYVRRLFRIAPLFYTMLALWLVVNYVLWDKLFTSQTLFLNVTFLFGLVPGFHESVVWAGWSIGIEMLFYLVFPVLILFAHDVKSAVVFYVVALVLGTAIQNALLGMDVGSYAYMNLGTHLPSFAAGIACFRIWEGMHFYRNKLAGWTLLSVALLLAVVLVAWKPLYLMLWQVPFGNLERNVWSIVFGAVILAVCITSVSVLERGPLRRLGKLSFSVYLLHPLLMLGFIKLGLPALVATHVPGLFAGFIVASMVTIGCVWLVSEFAFRFIETRGIDLGRRVAARYAEPARGPK